MWPSVNQLCLCAAVALWAIQIASEMGEGTVLVQTVKAGMLAVCFMCSESSLKV